MIFTLMPEQQIKIRAKDEDLKGTYSNMMQVLHTTKEEFILDFYFISPPEGVLSSRVIMSPGHLKRMIRALEDNVAKYEQKFGKIEEASVPESSLGFHVERQ